MLKNFKEWLIFKLNLSCLLVLPKDLKNKTIIVAPLDWGMGHVTRCIPLIRQFLENNNKVVFAGTKVQIQLVEKDFPAVIGEEIEGYDFHLNSARSFYWQMILQSLKLHSIIKSEKIIADNLVKKYNADVIVSDNRYGFKSVYCTNVFITHQLSPPVPFLRAQLSRLIVRWVNRFDLCWIPDDEIAPLCSDLYTAKLKVSKIKIGLLNRFKHESHVLKYKYLFIVSGPYPERGRFRKEVESILKKSESKYAIVDVVRGEKIGGDFFLNPSTEQLMGLINQSELIISRAGYTTIMELSSLNKKALLVPTEGQFEQEWLAKNINSTVISFMDKFELKNSLLDL